MDGGGRGVSETRAPLPRSGDGGRRVPGYTRARRSWPHLPLATVCYQASRGVIDLLTRGPLVIVGATLKQLLTAPLW